MNRVTHFEIPASDPERSMQFYRNAFNWSFNQFGNESYWLAITGDEKAPGINGAIMKRNDPNQPLTNNIQVRDIDASMKKVEQEGGTIVVPKTTIPQIGWFCYFKDPDGNIMGMMEEDTSAK